MAASWLKKLGQAVVAGSKLVPVYGPIISAVIPGDKDDKIIGTITANAHTLEKIAGVVEQAEVFGAALALPGSQKLTAAAPSVAQLILASSMLTGKEIADPVKFQAGCQQIAAGVADVLNSLKADGLPDA